MTIKESVFDPFRTRWNSRAEGWDKDIQEADHYVNFEGGYQKFLKFEASILEHLPKAESGIDLGCGTAIASGPLSEKVRQLYLLDLAESMLHEANRKYPNAALLHASATAIPLENRTIDYAVSRGVLISHLPPGVQDNFLSEVRRVLKPGGLFIFDCLNNLTTADFKLSSEKTTYTAEGIGLELERFGFENVLIDGETNNRVLRIATSRK